MSTSIPPINNNVPQYKIPDEIKKELVERKLKELRIKHAQDAQDKLIYNMKHPSGKSAKESAQAFKKDLDRQRKERIKEYDAIAAEEFGEFKAITKNFISTTKALRKQRRQDSYKRIAKNIDSNKTLKFISTGAQIYKIIRDTLKGKY